MRKLTVLIMLFVILVLANSLIIGKERLLKSGERVLLELAPRDPRSILQGDYMRLRYVIAGKIATDIRTQEAVSGHAVVILNSNKVARYARLYDGARALADGERLIYFRKRGRHVRLATDAFFFEEGQWKTYQPARYGEIALSPEGDMVMIGLRDKDFKSLGPPVNLVKNNSNQ